MKHLGTMTEMFVLGSYEVCVEEVVCVYDTMYTYQLHNVESSNDTCKIEFFHACTWCPVSLGL